MRTASATARASPRRTSSAARCGATPSTSWTRPGRPRRARRRRRRTRRTAEYHPSMGGGGLETGFLLDRQWHWMRTGMEQSKKPALLAVGRVLFEAGTPYALIGGLALQVHQ